MWLDAVVVAEEVLARRERRAGEEAVGVVDEGRHLSPVHGGARSEQATAGARHDAGRGQPVAALLVRLDAVVVAEGVVAAGRECRSEEHTSELQSPLRS